MNSVELRKLCSALRNLASAEWHLQTLDFNRTPKDSVSLEIQGIRRAIDQEVWCLGALVLEGCLEGAIKRYENLLTREHLPHSALQDTEALRKGIQDILKRDILKR